MKTTVRLLWLLMLGCFAAVGDASRGEEALRGAGCGDCHALSPSGKRSAPDLAKRVARGYTPTSVAAIMWNHAPAAWARLGQPGPGKSLLTEKQVSDVFAYFCSRRYFEAPGNAKRGKQFFAAGHCANCHSLAQATAWHSLGDPVAVAQRMWNLSADMRQASVKNEVILPQVTTQELTDFFLYLDNQPQNRERKYRFSIASAQKGRVLFQDKGCVGCHQGKLALEQRSTEFSLAGVAAAMWNHGTRPVRNRQTLSYDEMQNLIAYVWAARTCGSPDRGRKVFAKARCAGCHDQSGAKSVKAGPVIRDDGDVPTTLVSALWQHGPSMFEEMQKKQLAWPRLNGAELADLGAFLRTAPDWRALRNAR